MREIFKRATALLLCLLTLAAVSCGKNADGTQGTAETEQTDAAPSGYVGKYSDMNAAKEWIKKNIEDTDIPPVCFTVNGKGSEKLNWKKTVGETKSVTDYAESENPVTRALTDIVYVCEDEGLRIDLTLTSYAGYPVVEYDSVLTNTRDKNSNRIKDIMSLDCPLLEVGGDYFIHYNLGGNYGEYGFMPFTKPLYDNGSSNGYEYASGDGLPTGVYLPFFNAENKNGGGVITAVNWQGGWKTNFRMEGEKLYYRAGQEDVDLKMLPGEHMKVPGTVLLFYKDGDWQEGQNIWRRWIIEHNLMRYSGRRDFKQNLYACSVFEGAKRDIQKIKNLARLGIQKKFNVIVEFDAGWSDPGPEAWYMLGNWHTLYDGYADGGLKSVADAAHEAGMGFCMWVEPERLWSFTETGHLLGDKVLYLDDAGEYIPASKLQDDRMGIINYGDKEAEDFVVDLIDGIVKEYGLDVYRQDFNTSNYGFWYAYDRYEAEKYGMPRNGATENHACEGYINAWRRIAADNPGLIFDSCAAGGRRNDLETMRFSFMHTKSDYWQDARSQQSQNFGAYSWYIFTGTGILNPIDNYDIRTRLTLSVGASFDSLAMTLNAYDEWASLQKYMYCDFYQLGTVKMTFAGDIPAMQFNDPESGEGMLIAYMRSENLYDIVARGLEKDAHYEVYDKDKPDTVYVMSGEQLMTDGFTVLRPGKKAYAGVVFYKKTDKELSGQDRAALYGSAGRVDFKQFKADSLDISGVAALAAKTQVGARGAVYLCSDADHAGGIYAIGKELYEALPLTGKVTADGWSLVDHMKVSLENNGQAMQFKMISEPNLDLRFYVRREGDVYLMWFDNSFGIGDPCPFREKINIDGSRIICGEFSSDPVDFVIIDSGKVEGIRDLQFVMTDSKSSGAIYQISEKFYRGIKKSSATKNFGGAVWSKLDPGAYYLVMSRDEDFHDEDFPALYSEFSGTCFEKACKAGIYVCEKDGKYYLWIDNGFKMGECYKSDRWTFCWTEGDTLYRTVFYCYNCCPYDGVVMPDLISDFK